MSEPLAERLRPRKFDQFCGQQHLLGENKALHVLIEKNQIPSMNLWGPLGVGKTSLALFIAEQLDRPYFLMMKFIDFLNFNRTLCFIPSNKA